ncbi:aldehyde dehydrogenase family protein [Natrarchaeobius oligotrophus]|uniref:Aldehyde dehydrogenase family protein n=1 Tax=Natrarchaeobius chitinivorans TaxID=1679083 RepID=A0A3N6N0U1_NATCH|nr:aldehyde dehydrogenase family protein [Natrarchaeobius chitinivorans]RQH02452.1 aldehyde dehydrogenase family protein [Natrarchaeobius chitinivorans]
MGREVRLFIDGEWIESESDARIESRNPASPDEVVARVSRATSAEAERAVETAASASESWADRTPHERGDVLREAAAIVDDRTEEIAELIVREMGKTISAARGEVQRGIDLFDYYSQIARDYDGVKRPSADSNTLAYTEREPLGVAAAITPWNFPFAIPAWKIAPALVSGNAVAFKPASSTPATGAAITRALADAGLPDGVLNFVPGSGSDVGSVLTEHPAVDAISFTGSTGVGSSVQRTASGEGKRVQCEMGGKNPIVVDPSADLELAVELTVGGAFGLAGQACTATSRAIVFEEIYHEYLEALVDAVEALRVGDPLDPATDTGPKASADNLEEDLAYVQAGRDQGATVVTGGRRIEDPELASGHYVEPTVLADVTSEMTVAQEEIFGPVLSVLSVADYEEAIAVANDVEYGLSASICTNRLDHAKSFASDVDVGVVKVNQTSTGVELQLPFGGKKQSSSETFKEQGRQAIDFYTHEKAVYVTH